MIETFSLFSFYFPLISRSILQSSEFFRHNNVSKPTNMYFFLKPKCGSSASLNDHFQLQNCLRLPSACHITQLNIQTTNENAVMPQYFQIFNDDLHDDQETMGKESTEIYELNVTVKGFKEKIVKGKALWMQ